MTEPLAPRAEPRLEDVSGHAEKELFPWESARSAGHGRVMSLALGGALASLIGIANQDQLSRLQLPSFETIGVHQRVYAAGRAAETATIAAGSPSRAQLRARTDMDSCAHAPSTDDRSDASEKIVTRAAELGARVQVASYFNERAARTGWEALSAQHSGTLSKRDHLLVEGLARGRTVVRVQILTASKAEASGLCSRIREEGGDCFLPI
jgi:hypothetical protein